LAEDRSQAMAVIDKAMPLPVGAVSLVSGPPTLAESPSYVRIGSVFLRRGMFDNNGADVSLVHTPEILRRLESLAAACQSKRAVLLEGEVCAIFQIHSFDDLLIISRVIDFFCSDRVRQNQHCA
jgi:hypothetical protein